MRYEPTWPADRLTPIAFRLEKARPGGVAGGEDPDDVLDVRGHVGVTAWISCPGSMPWGQAEDQRRDEAASLTYTWGPLDDELEILGHPRLRVRVTSTAPVTSLSAKLSDVFPDGTSSLVTSGLLNLAHRASRERPSPLKPRTPRGRRARTGGVSVDVRCRPQERPSPADADPDEGWLVWRIEEDILGRERRAVAASRSDTEADDDVPAYRERYGGSVGVALDDPGRAFAESDSRFELRFPEATCIAQSLVRLESDGSSYRVPIDLVVEEDDRERWRRSWNVAIPRDRQ